MSLLDAILKQYADNNTPKYTKSDKVYDLKNYFNTSLKDGVTSATKEIRVLATSDGTTPFVEMRAHKIDVEGEKKTFACLQHEKGQPCPFCEAREVLLATGKEDDKELAKKYNYRLFYVVKIIDRSAEDDGVKFWRFPHDFRKEGNYDKIHGLLTALKKNRDITDPENGRDLSISINRNQNNVPTVTTIVGLDPSPLSEDAAKAKEWLSDTRTWEDVYSIKSYDYLEILVKGGIPVWNKEQKKFVDKFSISTSDADDSSSELTMGTQNVKSNVTVAAKAIVTGKAEVSTPVDDDDSSDDLPF